MGRRTFLRHGAYVCPKAVSFLGPAAGPYAHPPTKPNHCPHAPEVMWEAPNTQDPRATRWQLLIHQRQLRSLDGGCGSTNGGCGLLNGGCGLLNGGCGLLNGGCGLFDGGCGLFDGGCGLLNGGCGLLNGGCGLLNGGRSAPKHTQAQPETYRP